MTPLLTVEGISFAYQEGQPLLRSLYLELRASSVVGLVGRNGAGKSTLFGCMTGEIESEGKVFLRGEYLSRRSRSSSIGYLPQHSFLPKEVKVHRVLQWLDFKMDDERIEAMKGLRVGDLSTGQRRYLEFQMVMGMNKPIVVLDEPFSTVEPIYVERMIAFILKRRSERSVLISDHNISNLAPLCDSFYLLADGHLRPMETEADLSRAGYLP